MGKAGGAATTVLQCGTPVNAKLPAPLNASLPPNTMLSSMLLCPVSCGGCGAACSDPFAAVLAAANTTCVALKSKCNDSVSTIIPTVPSKILVKHACMKECSYCTTTATPTASPTALPTASTTASPTASPTTASSASSASSATSAPNASSPALNASSPAPNATSAPTAAPTKTSSAYSVSVFSIGLLSSMVINLL